MLPDEYALVAGNGRQVVVDAAGECGRNAPYAGAYSADHRLLAGIETRIGETDSGDDEWIVLGREIGDGSIATTLASSASGAGRGEQRAWLLTRSFAILDGGISATVALRNNTARRRTTALTVTLTPDFRHVFEVEEFFARRERPNRSISIGEGKDGIELAVSCADGVVRSVAVDADRRFSGTLRADAASLAATADLAPAAETAFTIRLAFDDGRSSASAVAPAPATRTGTETDSGRYAALASAAARALDALTLPEGVPAAGAPRFLAPFGRDSLVVGYQLLPVDAAVAERTLRFLAARQGTEDDPETLEAPGRIMHEYRRGDLPAVGDSIRRPYYGSVDATPLFVALYADAVDGTSDSSLARDLYPNAVAACEHVLAELDGRGLLSYAAHDHPRGLAHLGWKDSAEALARPDGTPANGAVALAEVQGYVHRALRRFAPLARRRGDADLAARCDRRADRVAAAFEERFWLPERGCYALALDDAGVVDSVASNQTHAFWGGLGRDDRVTRAVERLLEPDVLTTGGLRTFAASHDAFDPLSYHRGSVWPHDNSLAAMGFAARGHPDAATEVATRGLAALNRYHTAGAPDRYGFPELMVGGGDGRATVGTLRHPDACEPAAWSAGSVFAFLRHA
ncbi:glycogen debranching N-terminal domain-containing protein [Halomarina halobia]|uniref:Glycogen debranching N-terminal domain-containing protein n=1 Tax=Halomarina halobia TaxID=3033386 RepID=A0ABD6ADV8_9EURY|nr:glycogen debranching N-terminal domain-containing protein [Halomarina sp. PSR21]